jgi:DNA-binding response OmpR family regulator
MKPKILLLDDDLDFLKHTKVLLESLNLEVETSSTAEIFIDKFKTFSPNACLIDLNLDGQLTGFFLIKKLREILGFHFPLIVVSSKTDSKSITHALELGANDFITKPIAKDILINKLIPYIQTEIMAEKQKDFVEIPFNQTKNAELFIKFTVTGIDEFGLTIESLHLLARSTVLYLSGDFLNEITGEAKSEYLMSVTNTWIIKELNDGRKLYGAYLEFDNPSETLLSNLRKWITLNSN